MNHKCISRKGLQFFALVFLLQPLLLGCKTSAERNKEHAESQKASRRDEAKDRKENKVVNSPAGGIVLDDMP